MSFRSFAGLLVFLCGFWALAQCVATAPASDIRALIASAEGSPEGRDLIAKSLAKNPAPSNYDLAGIKSDLNRALASEVSGSISTAAPSPAPVAQPAAAEHPLHPMVQLSLIAAFVFLAIKAVLAAMRSRGHGPY